MVETDWRQILSFSQKELNEHDKDTLCESLMWMEADDIELNFTDLKTLFRLSQDILKYKNEQVNSLFGEIETVKRKHARRKSKTLQDDSPAKSSDSIFETINHQEELIKSNKDILEQLYNDIAELEGRKNKLENEKSATDKESDSSRDALSEINAIEQLENEVVMKNRHIRKLLSDVKALEDENTQLKEKTSTLKDKLTEATNIIENLTENLYALNRETSLLKDVLGKAEQAKARLTLELENLHDEIRSQKSGEDVVYEEVRSKVDHWKNLAKSKKIENDTLSAENQRLQEIISSFKRTHEFNSPVRRNNQQQLQIQELQEKLSEASNEILESAKFIEVLNAENKKLEESLKGTEIHDTSIPDARNESDDGKQRQLINKLKKKLSNTNTSLRGAEEMIHIREQEIAEITSQLQIIQSGEEGIIELLQTIKSKKRQLKLKDEGIKSLVQELNQLNQLVDELQLENESMRLKLNISRDTKIPTKGILKKFNDLEQSAVEMRKEYRRMENQLLNLEIENRNKMCTINSITKYLNDEGFDMQNIFNIIENTNEDNDMPRDGGGEALAAAQIAKKQMVEKHTKQTEEMDALIEENEGLRKGLQEILDYLKDNSTTTSGILAMECPSLEAVLQLLEARHSAGWLAPHMAAILELRAATGGRDALLSALHEARKETYDVMEKLSKESRKSQELEQKLNKIEIQNKAAEIPKETNDVSIFENVEFGTWMIGKGVESVDLLNKEKITNLINDGNMYYENNLRNSLSYFHNKFKVLFEKMTTLGIQLSDEQNKWRLQDEQYKAEIENLKAQIGTKEDEDVSDDSPGIVGYVSLASLQRKCIYLEESYKYIRTSNENLKNELLETKKDNMVLTADYETKIQKMVLNLANMTDKLRNSINIELFWRQNEELNAVTVKYRKHLNQGLRQPFEESDLVKYLQKKNCKEDVRENRSVNKSVLSEVEQTLLQKQIEQLCKELEDAKNKIDELKTTNLSLQEQQAKIIDDNLAKVTESQKKFLEAQLNNIVEENKILKEQCQHVSSQLDIALLEIHDKQQREMGHDMEVNLLRHQILDLQSTGDNKAIIARLSNEILVAHLQTSESHKKIERLDSALTREIQRRMDSEEMLQVRENIFNVYAQRYEAKFRYMYEVLQTLRQQYQGCMPLISLEKYLNTIEDVTRKEKVLENKLDEIEDIRSEITIKHNAFDEVLQTLEGNCIEGEDNCPHKMKFIILQNVHSRETNYYKSKILTLEQSRDAIVKQCNNLEKSLVLLNQGFEKTSLDEIIIQKNVDEIPNLEIEDIQSDEESSRRSQTITLPKPQVLKTPKNAPDMSTFRKDDKNEMLPGSPIKMSHDTDEPKKSVTKIDVNVQTIPVRKPNKLVQTDSNEQVKDVEKRLNIAEKENANKNKELNEAKSLITRKTEEVLSLNAQKIELDRKVLSFKQSLKEKDNVIEDLRVSISNLSKDIDKLRKMQYEEDVTQRTVNTEENKVLIQTLQKLECDKNAIVNEYKEMLAKEREEYKKTVTEMSTKILELNSKLDRKESDSSNTDAVKEVVNKYSVKIFELEDKCFKLQSDLDGADSEIKTYKSEAERWKELATERLTKMELLNSQLEERHSHEVESYKAENQHWMTQLNDTQREHLELRGKLTEQKAVHVKQLAEKDAQLEQQRNVIHNLKLQLMNMQTVMSVNDPSFDLSAIVEVEDSEGASQRGDDRLEIRFESSTELMRDDHMSGLPSTSSSVWQEPVIERLRREKQLINKQNNILRRQIKALAARERRSRLEAHNLKNQLFRISTSGSKAATAESVSLQSKIANLQSQLTSARRDTQSSVALWDKWKRSQQAAERWQAKFEEKCRELKKMETSMNFTKSALTRLEREKRMLLNRLSDLQHGKHSPEMEKQDQEYPEKLVEDNEAPHSINMHSYISVQSLMDRVEAQQRRIAALELAEKGNEPLVSEYEKSLAEITALKGQILKLESSMLEVQMRSPMKSTPDPQPELEYWKSYCDMLKEENIQLSMKLSAVESVPPSSHHHRVNDLEQTVLTLRGLVSKLQAEQKSGSVKRPDSRPGSGVSVIDKNRNQLESYRIEIANLKRSIMDKDHLLERSKEMLKIAAEREDELLRENAYLLRQLNDLSKTKGGSLSA